MTSSGVRVYTLQGCSHCETLKNWLKKKSFLYEEKSFDSEVQADFIMKNIFSDPPILELEAKVFTYDELFRGEELNEEKLNEILHEAF
jgi:glutaredoxin